MFARSCSICRTHRPRQRLTFTQRGVAGPSSRPFSVTRIRLYARTADDAISTASGGSSGERTEKESGASYGRRPSFLTAQTMTLFSSSPEALLVALEGSLRGMLNTVAKAGPAPQDASSPHHHRDEGQVLLYALSRDLPPAHLGRAVELLRTAELPSSSSASTPLTTIGVLCSPVPTSLIPLKPSAEGSAPPSTPTLHSVALSLLPRSHVIPFRSELRGVAPVQVGRWPEKKAAWKGDGGRADALESLAAEAVQSPDMQSESRIGSHGRIRGGGEGGSQLPGDWRKMWGRENVKGSVPDELASVSPDRHLTTLFFSDQSPQGLLEGLSAHFPSSSVLGLVAPPTPFETGRDLTLLMKTSPRDDKILDSGAVGVALIAASDVQAGAINVAKIRSRISCEGMVPMGRRQEITAAKGNIITALDGSNATQQFLREVQARTNATARHGDQDEAVHSTPPTVEETSGAMSRETAREISKDLSKDEDFYIGIFAESNGGEPLLVAQILSGHPGRGALSVDTDAELGTGLRASSIPQHKPTNLWAQIYHRSSPRLNFKTLEVPGPDLSVWSHPRFLFLSLASTTSSSSSEGDQVSSTPPQKARVMALPNLFVAASESGFISKDAIVDAEQGLEPLEEREDVLSLKRMAKICRVGTASGLLSLKAE